MRNKWEAGGRRPFEDWAVNQMAVTGLALGVAVELASGRSEREFSSWKPGDR